MTRRTQPAPTTKPAVRPLRADQLAAVQGGAVSYAAGKYGLDISGGDGSLT